MGAEITTPLVVQDDDSISFERREYKKVFMHFSKPR